MGLDNQGFYHLTKKDGWDFRMHCPLEQDPKIDVDYIEMWQKLNEVPKNIIYSDSDGFEGARSKNLVDVAIMVIRITYPDRNRRPQHYTTNPIRTTKRMNYELNEFFRVYCREHGISRTVINSDILNAFKVDIIYRENMARQFIRWELNFGRFTKHFGISISKKSGLAYVWQTREGYTKYHDGKFVEDLNNSRPRVIDDINAIPEGALDYAG